jgi:hypothetical protein
MAEDSLAFRLVAQAAQGIVLSCGGIDRTEWLRLARAVAPVFPAKWKPGRPPQANVTAALEAHRRGVAWEAIYPACIPRWKQLHFRHKRHEARKLKAAVHAWLARSKAVPQARTLGTVA